MGSGMRGDEGSHVERRLRLAIGVLGPDRAGTPGVAGRAGARRALPRLRLEPDREGQRAPERMPESETRMDEDAEWRRMERLGLCGPALEGMIGRPAKRIERAGGGGGREAVDGPARPAVEGMGVAVTGLGG